MITTEALYHAGCLVALYKSKMSLKFHHPVNTVWHLHSWYEVQNDSATAAVFKLSGFACKYCARLEQMGVTIDGRIHTTRLKN